MAGTYHNYFQNTSLDETIQLPPRQPPPRPHRAARRGSDLVEEMADWPINAGPARPLGRSMTADRRHGYLEVFQKDEAKLKAAYLKALESWKKVEPAKAEQYLNFVHNAVLASTSTVLATAMMFWYRPHLDEDVKKALEKLCEHYYGEAWLIEHLAEAERPDGSDGINPEIKKAAEETGMKFPSSAERKEKAAEVKRHILFGTKDDLYSVAIFEPFDGTWYRARYNFSWQQRLLKFIANFRVRKILLVSAPNRWLKTGDFSLTIDCQVWQWINSAIKFLERPEIRAAATKEAAQTYADVYAELKRFDRKNDCCAIVSARMSLDLMYAPGMRRWTKMAEGEEENELRKSLDYLADVYTALEEKHGPVVGSWREAVLEESLGDEEEMVLDPELEEQDQGDAVYPRTSEAGDENEDPEEVL